jgi:hypothetical protein
MPNTCVEHSQLLLLKCGNPYYPAIVSCGIAAKILPTNIDITSQGGTQPTPAG